MTKLEVLFSISLKSPFSSYFLFSSSLLLLFSFIFSSSFLLHFLLLSSLFSLVLSFFISFSSLLLFSLYFFSFLFSVFLPPTHLHLLLTTKVYVHKAQFSALNDRIFHFTSSLSSLTNIRQKKTADSSNHFFLT